MHSALDFRLSHLYIHPLVNQQDRVTDKGQFSSDTASEMRRDSSIIDVLQGEGTMSRTVLGPQTGVGRGLIPAGGWRRGLVPAGD